MATTNNGNKPQYDVNLDVKDTVCVSTTDRYEDTPDTVHPAKDNSTLSLDSRAAGGTNDRRLCGTKNLRRFNEISPEEHREICRKGAEKSKEVRQMKKNFKESVNWLLQELPSFDTGNEALEAVKQRFGNTLDASQIMSLSLFLKVVKDGDVRAYTTLRDTAGEMPVQSVDVTNKEPMRITIETLN